MSAPRDGWDELFEQAKRNADGPPVPDEWGSRVTIEVDDSFRGHWRGYAVDEQNDDRPVYLLWDTDHALRYHRHYSSLERELKREQPAEGDEIVIFRSENYQTQFDEPGEKTGQSYGVASQPSTEPLPGQTAVESAEDDSPPF